MLTSVVWIWILFTGCVLAEDGGVCEQRPCQNGGVCESVGGGFRCLCSNQSQHGRLFGGPTCSVALSGCDQHQCENGGICSPLLLHDRHTHTCVCPRGWTGPQCQTSTVFSFESRGHVSVEMGMRDPDAPLRVTFSFRTGEPAGTLLQRRVGALLLSIQLMDGRLRLLSLRESSSITLVQELPQHLSDHSWHTVEASLGGVVSLIRLLCSGENCSSGGGEGGAVEVLPPEHTPPPPAGETSQQNVMVVMGGAEEQPPFLGCFRDVMVDSRLLLPTSASSCNVTMGCSDVDKCEEQPCRSRGRCVTRGWRSYSCECWRPYHGHDCAHEYVSGRFGGRGVGSYAVFSLADESGDTVVVSMFLRTRQTSGLLLVLANSTSQYLRVWLDGGRVKVQVNNFESLVGGASVSDGHFHLVTVKLEGGTLELLQSAQIQAATRIRPVQAQPGDLVSVGGLPDPRASASFGGYFRGCIQDLRVNSRKLQFFSLSIPVDSSPLVQLVNVTEGCSSEDACTVEPCLNGGVCYSMWDDFLCTCPPSTAGRRCEQVKWCELSPCPAAAHCQLLSHGFECLSNVTFRPESGVLFYGIEGRSQRRLSSISLSFRSRQVESTLLRAHTGSSSLTISLQRSHLLMELQDPSHRLTVQSRRPLGDGRWHSVKLRLEEQEPNPRWRMEVDGGEEETTGSQTLAGSVDFLQEGPGLFLGGVGLGEGASFSGCLGPVEIGGLLLPFHLDTELTLPRPQEDLFTLSRSEGGVPPRVGCWGSSVCEPNPCENQGVCEDNFDLHQCLCPSDWAGPWCGALADPCASSPCMFGACTHTPPGWECVCERGYGGERCEVELDACEQNNCSHGATCLRGPHRYACLCPRNRTGPYCDEKVPDIPWYIETYPLPVLPPTSCLGSRWNYSCFHGGVCSDGDACHCVPGFTGQWCEADVDECSSDPCMNGGYCINYVNSFECVCDINYSGLLCQMDANDFYIYLFLGLWQNLFQLVSYLVIRMDDEPEIDWEFHVNDD